MTVSYSNAKADLTRSVNFAYELLATHGPAVFTDSEAIPDNYASDTLQEAVDLEKSTRDAMVSAWNAARTNVQRQTVQTARSVGYTGTDFTGAANYWIRYMTDSGEFSGGVVSEYFTARGVTRGTLNNPTNVSLIRVAHTRHGQASQQGKAEVIRATVASVSSSGQFNVTLQGEEAGRDVYDQQGSGAVETVTCEGYLSDSILTNANLQHAVADAASISASSINGWTVNASKWKGDTGKLLGTATTSILCDATGGTIEQALPANLTPGVPYIPYAIVNPTSQSSMSVRFDWGGINQSSISVGSDDSWNIIFPDRDGDLFPEQFDSAGGVIKLTVTLSGGELVVGRIGLMPLLVNNFGSYWGALVGNTDPVLNATSTITDTLSVSGKFAHVFALLGISLPVSGSNAISDPS